MPDTEATATLAKECELCGLPGGKRPYTQRVHGQERLFCCLGCMNVYLILSETGLSGQDFRESELFKRSLEVGLISRGGDQERPSNAPEQMASDASAQELVLQVQGMWCTSCAWLIEYALRKMPGVVAVEASFASDLVKVKYQPQFVPPDRIIDELRALDTRRRSSALERKRTRSENRALCCAWESRPFSG